MQVFLLALKLVWLPCQCFCIQLTPHFVPNARKCLKHTNYQFSRMSSNSVRYCLDFKTIAHNMFYNVARSVYFHIVDITSSTCIKIYTYINVHIKYKQFLIWQQFKNSHKLLADYISISLSEHVWLYGFKYLWNVNEEE